MKKKNKIILISSLSITLGTTIISPIAVICSNKYNVNFNKGNKIFNFDGKKFNSKQELKTYALNNVGQKNITDINRESWTIKFNNEILKFNSFEDLINFVNKQIKIHDVESSFQFDTESNLPLTPFELDKFYLKTINNEKIAIYRGANDKYFFTEKEAKDSYLQIHEAYYFDGVYFRNKQELSNYLNKNFEKYKDRQHFNSEKIVLVAPSGIVSRPLSPAKLQKEDQLEVKALTDFVNKYAKKYVKVENKNNEIKYYDANKLKENPGQYINEFDNYSYITVNSNQGKGNYIVDLDKEDEFQLFGPYYLQTGAEIEKINDPKSWKKLEGTDFSFVSNSLYADLLSKFVDLISNDKTDENSTLPFNIPQLKSKTETYFKNLKNASWEVFNSVMNLLNIISKGKRFSTFYKIPTLYIKTIEELMYYHVDYSLIQETREYYESVCDFLDKQMYLLIPKKYLTHKNNTGEIFSFKKLFKINTNNLDLNYDIESLIDIINQDYPKLILAINIISRFQTIGLQIPNFLPYDYEYVSNILKDVVNIKRDFNTIYDKKWLEQIYNIFISIDSNLLRESFDNMIQMNSIMLDSDQIENIHTQIISPRVQIANNAIGFLCNDLDKYMINPSNVDFKNSFLGFLDDETINKLIGIYKSKSNGITIDLINSLRFSSLLRILNPLTIFSSNMDSILRFQINLLKNRHFWDLNLFNYINNFFGISLTLLLSSSPLGMFIHGIATSEGFNNFISVLADIGSTVSDILDIFDKTCGFLKCVPFVSIALAIVEFLNNLVKTETFSYIFEIEDTKFIWNGGMETTYFFGLIPGESRGPESMKILPAQQITKPHVQNEYYYKRDLYDDLNRLKKDQIVDIATGNLKTKETQLVYKFDNKEITNSIPNQGFTEIGTISKPNTLLHDIYNDIVNDGMKYGIQNSYELADGNITFDANIAKDVQIRDFVDNKIQPVKIALLPNLKDGYPCTNKEGQELNSYILPETSWTSFGGFETNKTNNKYVVVDPNDGRNKTIFNSEEILINNFRNSFNVKTKYVFKNSTLYNDKFSDFNTNILNYFVYEVTNNQNRTQYFLNKGAAINWLLNEYEFSTNDFVLSKTIYIYKDKKFDSIDEYLNWIYTVASLEK